METVVDFFTGAETVAKFQRLFGVEVVPWVPKDGVKDSTISKKIGNDGYRLRNRHVVLPDGDHNGEAASIGLSSSSEEKPVHQMPGKQPVQVKVNSRFWYHLFNFGAALGDEIFFIVFLPFCFWNISMWVARRVVIMWVVVTFLGQGSKDIFKLPRPSCPPVVRLDTVNVYMKEYGMPSTHAMTGLCIPFTLLICTMNRYQYPLWVGLTIAIIWCILVCLSRIYLGMHSVLDIFVGLIFATVIMLVCIPYLDVIDDFLMDGDNAPWRTLGIGVVIVLSYPALTEWNSSRELATIVVSAGTGIFIGHWHRIRNEIQLFDADGLEVEARPIHLPDSAWLINMSLKTTLGLVMLLLTRTLSKLSITAALSVILRVPFSEAKSTDILWVELPRKFLTYMAVGSLAAVLCPLTFTYCNL